MMRRLLAGTVAASVLLIAAYGARTGQTATAQGQAVQAEADKSELERLRADVESLKAQLAQVNAPPAAPGVTPEQLAEVRRLVDEFKTELTVIGTDMAAIKTRLDEMDQQITDVQQELSDVRDVNKDQQAALDTLNRKRIDGYIQSRYTLRGTTDRGRAPENVGQDTTRGLTGNRDTFQVRRARINVRGDVTPRASYRVQLDARPSPAVGQDFVQVKEAYVTIKSFPFLLRTSQADEKPFATVDTTIGQQVTPFGYYLQFSSADRESPERYIAFSDTGSGLFPSQDYDKGVSLNGLLFGRYQYQLGFYNGNGTASNDFGRRKDFIGRIGVPLIPGRWNVGISGYDGEGPNTGTAVGINPDTPATFIGTGATQVAATRRRVKSLLGLDTQFILPFGDLKVEYVRGKGGLNGANQNVVPSALRSYVDAAVVEGYYAQLGFNVGNRLKVVGAYEYFNRNADPADSGPFSVFGPNALRVRSEDFAEERAHFGALYSLDAATRLRLWYEAPLNYPNAPGAAESVGRSSFYTAEVQVKF
uniref:Uncharacterized protein n=1 Tax=uncultured Armatimonadetes bacterium TaxID=157466 RepID=A0A6J4JZV9_9BACT|nr:hypothetical protein AVDCRST_MAG63-4428 [uncultured Armatimonadetes bacterium]